VPGFQVDSINSEFERIKSINPPMILRTEYYGCPISVIYVFWHRRQ